MNSTGESNPACELSLVAVFPPQADPLLPSSAAPACTNRTVIFGGVEWCGASLLLLVLLVVVLVLVLVLVVEELWEV